MPQRNIQIQPLTVENFQAFGEVISCTGHAFFHINDAHTERYHAIVETEIQGDAKAGISIFRNIKATAVPFQIEMLERHPGGFASIYSDAGSEVSDCGRLGLKDASRSTRS